jgi:hypothetical protein
MLRWARLGVVIVSLGGLALGAAAAACGGDETSTLCDPGTEVFCKCRGGFEGTKTCGEDGASFGECTTAEGACPEISNTTSSSSGDTTSGSGGGSTGTKQLYEPCADGSECASGTCEGFCTTTCTSYEECTDDANMLYGDCVASDGGTYCAPYCTGASDCSAYGAEVACGGAVALDDATLAFGACAVWGDALAGMPFGTPCDDQEGTILVLGDYVVPGLCSLDNGGVADVCVFGECTNACFENADCPMMDCESTGAAPACCTSAPTCGVQ